MRSVMHRPLLFIAYLPPLFFSSKAVYREKFVFRYRREIWTGVVKSRRDVLLLWKHPRIFFFSPIPGSENIFFFASRAGDFTMGKLYIIRFYDESFLFNRIKFFLILTCVLLRYFYFYDLGTSTQLSWTNFESIVMEKKFIRWLSFQEPSNNKNFVILCLFFL